MENNTDVGETSIQWTDRTWNPIRGCSRVSPGCVNCYAERQAARFAKDAIGVLGERGKIPCEQPAAYKAGPFNGFVTKVNGHPVWTGKVELIESKLEEPLHWKKPCRVFVNSMSDLFHESLPDEAIDRVFAVMALCPNITFQVLTKRAERMRTWFKTVLRYDRVAQASKRLHTTVSPFKLPSKNIFDARKVALGLPWAIHAWPLPNVWLGVSVESKAYLDRIDLLRETPAAIRFVSIEPLLEDLDGPNLRGIDWAIVGGESGPGARPFHIDWARFILSHCRRVKVAPFLKQLGSNPVWGHDNQKLHLTDSHGGDPSEWPEDMRDYREFPR